MTKAFQFKPHLPGLPPVYPKPPPRPPQRKADPRLDAALVAVAHELIGNRTYLVFGTGAVSLLTPHGTATASRLAHRAAKSPTSLGDVWDMFPDWDQFELDAPPNPARWYWVNWPEINARGNQYIIYDLQDGETPKRRQFKPTDEP